MTNELNGNTYDDIVWLEFVCCAPKTLQTQSFAVVESHFGAVDIHDEDLRTNVNTTYFAKGEAATHLHILHPDFRMLSTQCLGVIMPVILSGDGGGIGPSAELDTLVIGEVDVLYKEVGVERV